MTDGASFIYDPSTAFANGGTAVPVGTPVIMNGSQMLACFNVTASDRTTSGELAFVNVQTQETIWSVPGGDSCLSGPSVYGIGSTTIVATFGDGGSTVVQTFDISSSETPVPVLSFQISDSPEAAPEFQLFGNGIGNALVVRTNRQIWAYLTDGWNNTTLSVGVGPFEIPLELDNDSDNLSLSDMTLMETGLTISYSDGGRHTAKLFQTDLQSDKNKKIEHVDGTRKTYTLPQDTRVY